MRREIKISDLPVGMIIWKKSNILGITKATLPDEYYDYYCYQVSEENDLDYEIIIDKKANKGVSNE